MWTAIVLGISLILCEISIVVSVRALKHSLDRKLQYWEDSLMDDLGRFCRNEPSKSASILNAIGSGIGTSVKAGLMADLSHAKRQVNSEVADAAIQEISEQQPLLGGIFGALGKRGARKAVGSPLMQGALAALMGHKGLGDNNNGHSPVSPSVRHRD